MIRDGDLEVRTEMRRVRGDDIFGLALLNVSCQGTFLPCCGGVVSSPLVVVPSWC